MVLFKENTYALFRFLTFKKAIRNGCAFEVQQINQEFGHSQEQTKNLCKELMKMGLIKIKKFKPLCYSLSKKGLKQAKLTYEAINYYQHKKRG